jgi:hypothetical protein
MVSHGRTRARPNESSLSRGSRQRRVAHALRRRARCLSSARAAPLRSRRACSRCGAPASLLLPRCSCRAVAAGNASFACCRLLHNSGVACCRSDHSPVAPRLPASPLLLLLSESRSARTPANFIVGSGAERPQSTVVKLCSPYPRLFFFGITRTRGGNRPVVKLCSPYRGYSFLALLKRSEWIPAFF